MTFYRAITSQIFGMPNQPQVEIIVAYGPLVPIERRADLLIKLLEEQEKERIHFKQRVDYD